jgi:hypothetical protein
MNYLCPLDICHGRRRRPSYPLFPVKPFIVTFCYNIQGVSKLIGHTSGMSSPYQNKEKKSVSVYVRKHLFLEVEHPRSPDFNLFLISVTKAFLIPDKPHITEARPLNICDTPWSDVSMHTLLQLEGILSICCHLWPARTQQLLQWEHAL